MPVTLEKTFVVDTDAPSVWQFLTDPGNVASCLPGARLLEIVDERTFRGEVSLRLGLFRLVFQGLAEFTELDEERHCASLEANASELRGWGAGRMRMQSRLTSDGRRTRVDLQQSFEVVGRLSGMVATRLLPRAADFVLTRFASCVRSRLGST